MIIDDSLGYIILVYGWFLLEDYEFYINSLRFVNNVIVFDLKRNIECYYICFGVNFKELIGEVILYVILKIVDFLYSDDECGLDMFLNK